MSMEDTEKLISQLTGYEGTQADMAYLLRGGRKAKYHHAGDAAAGTAYTLPCEECTKQIRLKNANLIPEGGLTAHDTNYATISIGYNDGAGGAVTKLVSLLTKITGGTGDWVTEIAEAFAVTDAMLIAAGQFMVVKVEKAGTGVDCPGYLIDVEYELV
jgi:hypothetical protein